MEQNFKVHESIGLLGGDDNDKGYDDIKEMILDTNPILTIVTMVVSLLHTIFEFMAIKNGKLSNYKFYKNRSTKITFMKIDI